MQSTRCPALWLLDGCKECILLKAASYDISCTLIINDGHPPPPPLPLVLLQCTGRVQLHLLLSGQGSLTGVAHGPGI